MSSKNPYFITSMIALIVIFLVLIMFPVLNNQLIRLLKSHTFLTKFVNADMDKQDERLLEFKKKNQLTEKEIEIVMLLFRGYTYKGISESKTISENTVKFHIKNIYQKLNINNKMELIRMYKDIE